MNAVADRSFRLTPLQFSRVCTLLSELAGLSFEATSQASLERRLGERCQAIELPSFSHYLALLAEPNSPELPFALDAVTTGETYFFRQQYQLDGFVEECLPRLEQKNRSSKRLVLWCAGCSTGEEAYTLAMLLEGSGRFENWDVRIVGSDISPGRIEIARAGHYRENSFRTTTPEQRARHFSRSAGGWQVSSRLRNICQFTQLNLLNPESAPIGRVDVVFCRNVLIYLSPQARTRVLESFFTRLTPGGFLFLGHSESLLNLETQFEPVHMKSDLAYQRPFGSRMGDQ